MKYEWKKEERGTYLPNTVPALVNIPSLKYITITGEGNPNNEDFKNRIEVLYSLSYAIRMMPKGGYTPEGYFEYTVYPLEGLWSLTEVGQKMQTLDKDELLYKIMIRQPDFVTKEIFDKALMIVRKKKSILLLDDAKFEEIEDGLCVQIMHVGAFDDEPRSFEKMDKYIEDNNYIRTTLMHKEIYISDFRRTASDKLKTVLRYFVAKK